MADAGSPVPVSGWLTPNPPGPGWSSVSSLGSVSTPPERDRILINVVWEAALALAAIAAIAAMFATNDQFPVTSYFGFVAPIGLYASAIAFSLRAGAPNLAVGSIGLLAATVGADLVTNDQVPVAAAMIVGVVVGVLVSLILGVLTAVVALPSWASTIAAGAIIELFLGSIYVGKTMTVTVDYRAAAVAWFLIFVGLSVGGALIWWLVPGVRRAFEAGRRPGLPGRWPGWPAAIGTAVAITGSGLLASLAGIASLLTIGAVFPTGPSYSTLFTALAVALLGGTSVFGRRAGLLGTLLATLFVVALTTIIAIDAGSLTVRAAVLTLAAVVGLGVSRVIEVVNNSFNPGRRVLVLEEPSPAVGPMGP
jgi:ribose/xylose/arabinose/galactoside ABC-type transport system permease subunit